MSRRNRRFKTHQVVSVADLPDELKANLASKKIDHEHEQRGDTRLAMKRITVSGWNYDEEIAKSERCSDVGYYISEVKKCRITPEDAAELYHYHNYAHNRNFDQLHATQLSKAINVVPALDIAIAPGGKPIFVNGQHSLWAIHMKDQPITASITIYQCRDEAAVARLYAIFDSNKKRSQQAAIDAAKGSGDLKCDVSSNKLARWSMCVAVAETGFMRVTLQETLTDKIERVHRQDVQEFASWIEELTNNVKTGKLITQGVGSAFYAMFLSDRTHATEFVKRYIDGVGLEANSPILKLRDKMLNRPEGEHGSSVCLSHAEMVYSAWRKFCLGEPLQVLRRTVTPECDKWKVFVSPGEPTEREVVEMGAHVAALKI